MGLQESSCADYITSNHSYNLTKVVLLYYNYVVHVMFKMVNIIVSLQKYQTN